MIIEPASSGAEFQPLLDAFNDPVLGTGRDGYIHYANGAVARLLGWDVTELVGKPLVSLMPQRLRSAHEAGFRRFMTTHESRIIGRPIRVPALHRSGVEIEVELTLSEVHGFGSTCVIAVLRDLRDRIELERKIEAQRKILAQYAAVAVLADATSAVEAMPRVLEATAQALKWELGIYWAQTPGGDRLAVAATWSSGSTAARRFLAGSAALTFARGDPMPGAVVAANEAVWSRDLANDPRYARSRLAQELGFRSALLFPVYCAQRTWGVLEYVSMREEELDEDLRRTMTALGFQIGQFLERLETEEALRRAWAQADAGRKNLHQLFEDAPAAIAIIRGPEMRYELSNATNQELAGGRQLVGRTVREALPELEADGITSAVQHVFDTGEPFVAREYPVTRPEAPGRASKEIFMNGVVQPLHGPTGAVEGVMLFAYDVTDLVLSRERVRDAEERLRLAVDAATVGTWDYHPQSGVVTADPRYRRLFGLGPDAPVTGDILAGAIHPEDRARVDAAVSRSLDPHAGGEFGIEYRTRGIEDGVERWVAVRGRTIFDENGQAVRFLGTGVDVTSERRALTHLQFLAEASTVLSSSLDYRATLDEMARLAVPRFADMCFVELTGEDRSFIGAAVAHVDPAKARLAREVRRRYPLVRGSVAPIERVFETGQPLLVPTVTEPLLREMARDEDHLRMLRELGARSMMLVPLKTRGGTIAVLGLVHSESGRRYTPEDLPFAGEVARRAATAVENARLYERATKAVGVRDQFLSIASHELRTPLTGLILHLSTLRRAIDTGRFGSIPSEKLAERIRLMDHQASRLSALIDELLDVSRISSGRLELKRERLDLNGLVNDVAASMTGEATKAGASISITGESGVVGSWDRSRLDQIVTNLVANAIKYAPGGPIWIDVARRDGTAIITVSDRGPGIPVADQGRIFDQFERVAPPGQGGLGLGLWIARRIVEAHGGSIGVASRPGDGAVFSVRLPLEGSQ